MNSDKRRGNARGRGRGRGRARGRGRGRGKKVPKVMSSDEEEMPEEPVQEPERPPSEPQQDPEEPTKMEVPADISQLEAVTFTTLQRGPPEPMLRLEWSHRATLIGEKVLNPMIYCCDTCSKPILIYGRMIPCKHVFCLSCARADHALCPRCHDKVLRVEQTGLGTVFMCTHAGTRYGNAGCRRTYLSQRDLQAHINHRHMSASSADRAESKPEPEPAPLAPPTPAPPPVIKPISLPPAAADPRGQTGAHAAPPRGRTNLITVPLQEHPQHQQEAPRQYYNYYRQPQITNTQAIPPTSPLPMQPVPHNMSVPPPAYYPPAGQPQQYPAPATQYPAPSEPAYAAYPAPTAVPAQQAWPQHHYYR